MAINSVVAGSVSDAGTPGFESLKRRALGFVECCRVKEESPYAYSMLPGKPALYMASGNAAILYRLFGALDRFTEDELDAWADYINSGRRDDGYIFESWITEDDQSALWLDSFELVVSHSFHIALLGLLSLGRGPQGRLRFIHPFLDPGTLQAWLDTRDWSNSYSVCGQILAISENLGVEAEVFGDERGRQAIDVLTDELLRRQNPDTGYWDAGCDDAVAAMAASFHAYPLFIQHGRDIPHKRAIIDSTLALQTEAGFFSNLTPGGAYTHDYAAAHILVNMARMIDYRRPEIEEALLKLRSVILPQMCDNGGFPPGSFPFNCYLKQAMADTPEEPALWCTLFRYRTIALVSMAIEGDEFAGPWDFRGSPNAVMYPPTCGLVAPM